MKDWKYSNWDEPSDEKDQFLMAIIRSKELTQIEQIKRIKKLIAAGVSINTIMQNSGNSVYFENDKWWTPLYLAMKKNI